MTARTGTPPTRSKQRGSITILVAIGLLSLLAVLGLAIDSGQLYVNKSELQSAADSCALAAARELVCDSVTAGAGGCPSSYLANAALSGQKAASMHLRGFQATAIGSADTEVRFGNTVPTSLTNYSNYAPAATAPTNSRFAGCVVRATGIKPFLTQLVGAPNTDLSSAAVATLAPGQAVCATAPIGLCKVAGSTKATNFGYAPGAWVVSQYDHKQNGNADATISGSFGWADLYNPAGSPFSEQALEAQLVNVQPVCNTSVKLSTTISNGAKNGARDAYNTVFGIYAKSSKYTAANQPPDRTGFSFPTDTLLINNTTAYATYLTKQSAYSPFNSGTYSGKIKTQGASNDFLTTAEHQTYATDRRLRIVPVVDCGASGSTPVNDSACVLMLNPIDDNNGNNSVAVYLQYIGSASAPGSPCRSSGLTGGPASAGPLVPTPVM